MKRTTELCLLAEDIGIVDSEDSFGLRKNRILDKNLMDCVVLGRKGDR